MVPLSGVHFICISFNLTKLVFLSRLRTGFRCDKLTCIFGLDNGLALKAETGTTKFKLKGAAKALGCNQVPL
jgi:hypothetical protein